MQWSPFRSPPASSCTARSTSAHSGSGSASAPTPCSRQLPHPVVDIRLASGRDRPAMAAAQRRRTSHCRGAATGSVPPVPLALTVDATLADHGASDRYELLAHRGAPVNAVTPATPWSTTRRHREPRRRRRAIGRANTPSDLSPDPTVASRPRSRHARARGAGSPGQPLRAELRPPDRRPGRI